MTNEQITAWAQEMRDAAICGVPAVMQLYLRQGADLLADALCGSRVTECCGVAIDRPQRYCPKCGWECRLRTSHEGRPDVTALAERFAHNTAWRLCNDINTDWLDSFKRAIAEDMLRFYAEAVRFKDGTLFNAKDEHLEERIAKDEEKK